MVSASSDYVQLFGWTLQELYDRENKALPKNLVDVLDHLSEHGTEIKITIIFILSRA